MSLRDSSEPLGRSAVERARESLGDRLWRGVGNPCPLVLIGLPDTIVTFHEGKAALAEVEAAEAAIDAAEEAEA